MALYDDPALSAVLRPDLQEERRDADGLGWARGDGS
jgi:hypothetical protein